MFLKFGIVTFVILLSLFELQEISAESTDSLVKEYNLLIDKFDKIGTNSEKLEVTQKLLDDINSDLEKFEKIVINLQNNGYDGRTELEDAEGELVATVYFFDKKTSEPLFERQIPSGTLNIFGTMGLIKEFETAGMNMSLEEQASFLNSSKFISAIASFRGPSDPNNEIASQMILSSIAAYHPSIDDMSNSKSSSTEEIPSLKMQEKLGIIPMNFVCKDDFQKIIKGSDNSPACVKPESIPKLIERGWAKSYLDFYSQITPSCLTFDEAKSRTNFLLKSPAINYLNFTHYCAQASPIDARLIFYNEDNLPKRSENQFLASGGIIINITLNNESTNPAYGIENKTRSIISMSEKMVNFDRRLTNIQGNIAVAREQCDSCGVFRLESSDGTTIEAQGSAPSMVSYYNGDVLYSIEGYYPTSILEKIGNLMK